MLYVIWIVSMFSLRVDSCFNPMEIKAVSKNCTICFLKPPLQDTGVAAAVFCTQLRDYDSRNDKFLLTFPQRQLFWEVTTFLIVTGLDNGVLVSGRRPSCSHGSCGRHVDTLVESDTFSDNRPEFFISR